MKNIIYTIVLLCGFFSFAQAKKPTMTVTSVSPNAKMEALSPEAKAAKNLAELNAFIPLNKTSSNLLLELFTTKANMLANSEGFSQERRDVVAQIVTSKMESVLPADAMAKIKGNAALLKSLTY